MTLLRQGFGEARHELAVRNFGANVFSDPTGLLQGPFLVATRTKAATATREGHEQLVPALRAPHPGESVFEIATRQKPGDGRIDDRPPEAITILVKLESSIGWNMLGVFLPLQLIAITDRLPTVLWAALWATWFVSILWLLAERRRATTFVRAKVGITAAEASAILTTSTFGVPTWRRAPISSLLGDQGRAPRHAIEAADAGDTTIASERPTQL